MSELQSEMTAADLVAERMKKDPKVQAVVAEAHLFDGLRQDPGWKRLFEVVVRDKKRVTDELARRMMAGQQIPPEEVEFYRGFYRGAVYVLMHPEVAEKNLERAANVAWLLAQKEVQQQQEEQSPYITG